MFSKISSVTGCETCDASCDAIGFSAAVTEATTRDLDRTAGVWPFGGAEEVVARRVPAIEPFAPLLEGVEESCNVGARFWILVVDK